MPASPWRLLSEQLVAGGRVDLQRELSRAVRQEGDPTVRAVRAAWLSIEVTSSRGGTVAPDVSTGLRRRVAAATGVSATKTGVRVTVSGRMIDPVYGTALAWYLNASGRPWRHPVFGRRDTWVEQRGREVFFSTVRARQPAFRAAIAAAMESTARKF
jgi:hypothetical protein